MRDFDALYNPNIHDPFSGQWFDPKVYRYIMDVEMAEMIILNRRKGDKAVPPHHVSPIPERYYSLMTSNDVFVDESYDFCPGVDRKRVEKALC